MNNTEGNKLSDKIREVFDNYEDEGAAEAWEQLRRKYPARDSRPVFLWIGSIAAVLLLSTAMWFWPSDILNNGEANTNAQIDKDSLIINDNNKTDLNARSSEESKIPETPLAKHKQASRNNKNGIKTANTEHNVKSLSIADKMKSDSALPGNLMKTASNRSAQTNDDRSNRISTPDSAILLARSGDFIEQNNPPSADEKMKAGSELPDLSDAIVQSNPHDSISTRAESARPLLDAKLAGLGKPIVETELPIVDSRESGHVLSVYGGSFINFAVGSESALNFTAGLSSDLKISNRLKLSTGLSLARNSLSFENGVPTRAQMDYKTTFASPGSVQSGNLVSLDNYTAELINLDIPVNLKYQVGTGKSDLFISAGLSSGTYISERYVSDYRAFNLNSGAYGQTAGSSEINKEFAEFDFARTFNFSFGFTTGFGKKQSLTFEPFLKYPLSGLGSQDIRFGSSGINVKLNLRNQK